MASGSWTSTTSLSRRVVAWAGVALFLILAALGWVVSRLLRDRVMRDADARLVQAAEQAALVIDRVVAERGRQVQLLASLPGLVDAARTAAQRAAQLGLPGQPIEELERRFDATRTLDIDPRSRQFLLERATSLDLAEVLVTEQHGFNAITTERTSDFVQSDEAWWQHAMTHGITPAEAAYDESARKVSVSVSAPVRETDSAPALGVMKAVYGLAALQDAAHSAGTPGVIAIAVIDSAGRVLARSEGDPHLTALPGQQQLPRSSTATIVRYNDGTDQRAALRTTNGRTWRVVAHEPESLVLSDLARTNTTLGLGAIAVFLLIVGALVAINSFMTQRIAQPAAALAAAAEAVAAGNLAVRVAPSAADDEIGRLGRATQEMIGGLRRLTLAIKRAASETAAMALDLTASSEDLSASAQQMARTSADLSQQSTEMAQTVQEMSGDADRLSRLSAELKAGVTDGVQRNQRLRALARDNRDRLDASANELDGMVGEVQRSVESAEALATAFQEIREFVAFTQHIAKQSKLLAFSAGMEAKRAGPEGAGFVVVAKEVQRLADATAEAAQKTEKVVTALLEKVEESRASSARSATTVARVRGVHRAGLEAFGSVEAAVADTEAWTAVIEQTASASNRVVETTTERLGALARGIESFAAAMEEVAASAQEQSASSEEIVATATALSESTEQLSAQTAAFQLEEKGS